RFGHLCRRLGDVLLRAGPRLLHRAADRLALGERRCRCPHQNRRHTHHEPYRPPPTHRPTDLQTYRPTDLQTHRPTDPPTYSQRKTRLEIAAEAATIAARAARSPARAIQESPRRIPLSSETA